MIIFRICIRLLLKNKNNGNVFFPYSPSSLLYQFEVFPVNGGGGHVHIVFRCLNVQECSPGGFDVDGLLKWAFVVLAGLPARPSIPPSLPPWFSVAVDLEPNTQTLCMPALHPEWDSHTQGQFRVTSATYSHVCEVGLN